MSRVRWFRYWSRLFRCWVPLFGVEELFRVEKLFGLFRLTEMIVGPLLLRGCRDYSTQIFASVIKSAIGLRVIEADWLHDVSWLSHFHLCPVVIVLSAELV